MTDFVETLPKLLGVSLVQAIKIGLNGRENVRNAGEGHGVFFRTVGVIRIKRKAAGKSRTGSDHQPSLCLLLLFL